MVLKIVLNRFFNLSNDYENNNVLTCFLFQEYELDGIDWKRVDFKDNHECLDLFEKVSL